jgi:hypothetical protein
LFSDTTVTIHCNYSAICRTLVTVYIQIPGERGGDTYQTILRHIPEEVIEVIVAKFSSITSTAFILREMYLNKRRISAVWTLNQAS